jgi:hypothetical protein
MGLSIQYLPKSEGILFQKFCHLIEASEMWNPDTSTVRVFSGKFDPEEFSRNPGGQGQLVDALSSLSFCGKRLTEEAIYGEESRQNRRRLNISALGIDHYYPAEQCPVPVPGVPAAPKLGAGAVAVRPEVRAWLEFSQAELKDFARAAKLAHSGTKPTIAERLLRAGKLAPARVVAKKILGVPKFFANSTRRPALVASEKMQQELIKWQRLYESDSTVLCAGYHIFTDEQFEASLLKAQALRSRKFAVARSLLPEEPILPGTMDRRAMVDIFIKVRAAIVLANRKSVPPKPELPLVNMSTFTTRCIPLSIVLNPELQSSGDPRFFNTDASRALARGSPGSNRLEAQSLWGQGCPVEMVVPPSFSPLKMLASRRAGLNVGATSTPSVCSAQYPGSAGEMDVEMEEEEREEAVEEEENLQCLCLGSDDTTDLTALMAEEEAHAEADEEEEDFDDGIPEDDE